MIRFVSGSLFDSEAQTLVNPVNTVGVSGAGLAKEFKKRWPKMHEAYALRCERGHFGALSPEGPLWLWHSNATGWTTILCFATKEHWRDPSELEFIEAGLAEFVRTYQALGITSIAFPALGCGNGGLDWADVMPLMTRYLEPLDLPIAIHEPMPKRRT